MFLKVIEMKKWTEMLLRCYWDSILIEVLYVLGFSKNELRSSGILMKGTVCTGFLEKKIVNCLFKNANGHICIANCVISVISVYQTKCWECFVGHKMVLLVSYIIYGQDNINKMVVFQKWYQNISSCLWLRASI